MQVWQRRGLVQHNSAASSALRGYYAYLCAEAIRKDNPATYLASPKLGKSLPDTLDEEEVTRLLDSALLLEDKAQALMMSAGIEMLYATGLRISELLSLRESALIANDKTVTIMGKGGKERLVLLTDIELKKPHAGYHGVMIIILNFKMIFYFPKIISLLAVKILRAYLKKLPALLISRRPKSALINCAIVLQHIC